MGRPPAPSPLPADRNIGVALMILTGILTTLVLVTSGLRFYVRLSLRSQGWDDYTMMLVTLLALARMGVQSAQVAIYSNGRHRWYISESNYINNNMLGWYAQILLFAAVCFLKVSILLLIMRLKDERRLRFLLYGVISGLFITNFGSIIILIAECSPPSVYWTGVGGTCWDTRVRIYAIYCTIAYSIATDLLCSLLPLYVVWRIHIQLQTKVAVCCLMSLGLIATGFGIARAASLGLVTVDLSWDYAISAIWSNLELFLGIITANLALSRSIYAFFRDGKATSNNAHYNSQKIRLGYLQPSILRPQNDTAERPWSTIVREPSISRSDESEAPLEPSSHKRMECSTVTEYK